MYSAFRCCGLYAKTIGFLGLLLFSSGRLHANNIRVSQVALTGQNVSSGFVNIRFDLAWDNSWRLPSSLQPANYDAAWVFAKFRIGFVDPIFVVPSASSGSSVLSINTTDGLRVGMPLRVYSGSGSLANNTTITAIDTSAKTVTLSAAITGSMLNTRLEANRIWEHAWLNDTGHSTPAGSALWPGLSDESTAFNAGTNPVKGVFVYRNAVDGGTFSLSNVAMRWNYREQGVIDVAICDLQVFAIEMVKINEGAFFVGTGGSETSSFTAANSTSGNTIAFEIGASAPTIQGNNASSLATNLSARGSIDLTGTSTATLAAGFPTGFSAFFMLKYELSQQQYVDFLNTLTRRQQDSRTATDLSVGVTTVTNRYVMSNSTNLQNRNGIRCNASISAFLPIQFYVDADADGVADEANDGRGIACNFLSWADLAAYLDWAGLRPLTELEFEKAGRGVRTPVPNTYPWSTANITAAAGISNAGEVGEVASNAEANAAFGNQGAVDGPLRNGVFGRPTSGKAASGAGESGCTEMAGNVWERVVTIGNATGRDFTGLHGNGSLNAAGVADVSLWPAENAVGTGARGGSWFSISSRLLLSDRDQANTAYSTRNNDSGGRGARSIPSLAPIDGGL